MSEVAVSRFRLRWTDSTGAPAERDVPAGSLVIGRAPDCGIVLDDPRVSRAHARLEAGADGVTVHDLGSRNGTYVNDDRVDVIDLAAGDQLTIGSVIFQVVPAEVAQTVGEDREQIGTIQLEADEVPSFPSTERGIVTTDMLRQPVLAESALADAGVEVITAEFAALGGGLGSFVWVDLLRNSGVTPSDIVVAGVDEKPYARYERLCQNSQIPSHERLRSNSDSCPDNVWGFPGYATREAWQGLTQGQIGSALGALWNIFGEPAVAQTYTPRSGDVFRSIDREAARIGWGQMLRRGRIRAIRKSAEGRILAIVSASDAAQRRHFAVAGRFVQLALGYPAIQLLPDLAAYRERYQDHERVVNAYEQHDHVYEQLRRTGGTVLIRGRGIVASRVIQRLWEERRRGAQIAIVHLHRSNLTAGHRYGLARRVVDEQWEYQPFNWPKASWSGEMRERLERASAPERQRLLGLWGGTTTANRRDWRQMIAEGVREGWYRPEFGTVEEVSPTSNGRVMTRIAHRLAGGGTLEIPAEFIIDCTGLIASPNRNPLLDDLITMYQIPLNPLGRLAVSNDFEVEGMQNEQARLYACGSVTLGGPYAAVDSFLGLQFAALAATRSIVRTGRPKALRRLNGFYSFRQWLKWARGATP